MTNYTGLGQFCSWHIQCAAPNVTFMTVNLTRPLASTSAYYPLTIVDSESNVTLDTLSSLLETTVLQAADVKLKFNSTAHLSYLPPGWTLSFDCSIGRCSSANATRSAFSTTEGRLISDTDGNSSTQKYNSGEYCKWSIQCPTGMYFIAASVSTTMSSYHGLNIKDATTGELLHQYNGSLSRVSNVFGTGLVVVEFDANYSSSGSYSGWTLDWKCLPSRCYSPGSTSSGSSSGILKSDPDGHLSSYRQTGGQHCAWSIHCPLSTDEIYLSPTEYTHNFPLQWRVDTNSGNSSSVDGTLDVVSGVRVSPAMVHSGGNATVSLGVAPETVYGASLGFTCQPHKCSSPNRTGSTYNGSSGRFLGDPDSVDSYFTLGGGEDCEYNITCPAPYNYILLTVQVRSRSSGDSLDATVYEGMDRRKSRTWTGSPNVSWSVSTQALPLNTSQHLYLRWVSSNSSTLRAGWQVQYSCMVGSCTSPNSTLSIEEGGGPFISLQPGRSTYLVSDADGAQSGVAIPKGTSCRYRLQCPAGTRIYAELRGSVGYGSEVGFYSPYNDQSPVVQSSAMNYDSNSNVFLPSNTAEFFVNTMAENITSDPGYTAKFTCDDPQNRPKALDCYVPSGTIVNATWNQPISSDYDGYFSRYLYPAGQSCHWIRRCPATEWLQLTLDADVAAATELPTFHTVAADGVSKGGEQVGPTSWDSGRTYTMSSSVKTFNLTNHEVYIDWTTHPSFISSRYTRYGFRIGTACMEKAKPPKKPKAFNFTLCPLGESLVAGINVSTATAKKQELFVPTDGECVYHLDCTKSSSSIHYSMFVMIRGGSSDLSGGIYDTTGSLTDRRMDSGSTGFNEAFVYRSKKLLALEILSANSKAQNVNVSIACLNYQIKYSQLVPVEISLSTLAYPGREFSYSSSYENNADRTSMYLCSTGYSVRFSLSGSTAGSSDYLTVMDPIRQKQLRYSGVASATSAMIAEALLLRFVSDGTGTTSGYTVELDCVRSGGIATSSRTSAGSSSTIGVAIGVFFAVLAIISIVIFFSLFTARRRSQKQQQHQQQHQPPAQVTACSTARSRSPERCSRSVGGFQRDLLLTNPLHARHQTVELSLQFNLIHAPLQFQFVEDKHITMRHRDTHRPRGGIPSTGLRFAPSAVPILPPPPAKQ